MNPSGQPAIWELLAGSSLSCRAEKEPWVPLLTAQMHSSFSWLTHMLWLASQPTSPWLSLDAQSYPATFLPDRWKRGAEKRPHALGQPGRQLPKKTQALSKQPEPHQVGTHTPGCYLGHSEQSQAEYRTGMIFNNSVIFLLQPLLFIPHCPLFDVLHSTVSIDTP